MMNAQQTFDAALADEAVRAKLNRLAAESEGWTGIDERWDGTINRPPVLVGRAAPSDLRGGVRKLPDYTRSLTAAARLKLPGGYDWERKVYGNPEGNFASVIELVWYDDALNKWIKEGWVNYDDHTPEAEALARVCCIAAAKGWKV